jgi:NOL1/NOP2/sun family putative RNA methylase
MNNNKNYFIKKYKSLFDDFNLENSIISQSLRINTIKIKEEKLVERLKSEGAKLKKINFLKNGYVYESKFSMGSTPEYLQGYYYLQEVSSQIPVEILNPKENDLILDMCAAPGSKTTQLAQYMNNNGTIIALDKVKWRLLALRNNLERTNIKNTIIYNKDARFINDFKKEFDKILLDAPCSGNFTTDQNWFEKRTQTDIEEKARTQKQLLKSAVSVLKKNGIMTYSTCTLEPEENELVIDWALENLDIELLEIDDKISSKVGSKGLTNIYGKKINSEISKTLRILPWRDNYQPFFIAKIKKK